MRRRQHFAFKKIVKKALKTILAIPGIGHLATVLHFAMVRLLLGVGNRMKDFSEVLPLGHEINARRNAPENLFAVARYYLQLESQVGTLPYQPLVSILVPVYKVQLSFFVEMLESVAQQIYENWEICLVDDCSNDPALATQIDIFKKRFPGRVQFSTNPANVHISVTSNNCLALARGNYIALLDHDDRLYPNALAEMVRYINLNNKPNFLYSDERLIDAQGQLIHRPYFKPGYSPLLHLCSNYTTHLSVYKTEVVKKIGGFRVGFEGSQDHDLALRVYEVSVMNVVHVPFCLYQWRAHAESTASGISKKPYAAVSGEKAVAEALVRRGLNGKPEWSPKTFHYRLNLQPPECMPTVSIVIPSKNAFEKILLCLKSVFEKSTYSNFNVIVVDNGSHDFRCFKLYEQLQATYGIRFSFISSPGAFNFAKLNNLGVKHASGEYVVLLNNDTEVLSPRWLEELLALGALAKAGAVGCKLLFPNERIQHGGVLLIDRQIACHAGVFQASHAEIYNQVLQSVHEVSAVTAACLLVEKAKYNEVGGLDEVHVPNGFGDVDFCLKLSAAGYTNYYTPEATLRHYESATRKVTLEHFEKFYLLQKWPSQLLNDPFLNPNLLRRSDYKANDEYLGFDLNKKQFANVLKKGWREFHKLM